MKKTEELKKYLKMDVSGLEAELQGLEKDLVSDRLRVRAGKLENISAISKKKKTIARIKTLINAKEAE